ncbi:MAG: hypothetical protein AAGG51_12265 [Cyanobacteria bacterium P01_G01_bin.54]
MQFLPRSSAIASLSTIVLLLASGCGASKVAQCNSIIEVANSAAEEAQQLAIEGVSGDPQVMLKAAEAMEQASTNMQALEIEDESLQGFQTDFVEMYSKTSSASRDLVDALEKEDREAAEASLAELQEVNQSEQEIVNGVNGYCQG